ncbi:RsiW-degrading membrane proteinase PrsW (M82 family) [Microbacterium testaceum]|nr:RsiW-degrading membrane proteinase PrsW (M82 family) [Microbacterium sp. SORGH_AS_0969]MDQ1115792.1 RsiW-degrading membrane proteinase PrsW (M82 family) [Microbacterium testaceum]
MGGLLIWLYMGIVLLHLLRNVLVLPAWVFISAALVPATVFWIMLHRLRTTDTVTAINLVVAAVIGGTLAVTLGATLDQLVEQLPQPHFGNQGVIALLSAGFVEEFAKGVLIVAVGWKIAKSARNGLFIGGSVGLGFAVLESMGYINMSATGADPIISAVFQAYDRGLYAPFMHVLWSSLLGAALFAAAAKKGRFRLSWLVLGTYVGVAVLHGTWDGVAPLVLGLTNNDLLFAVTHWSCVVVVIFGGGFIWRHVARKAPAPPVQDAAPVEDSAKAVPDSPVSV